MEYNSAKTGERIKAIRQENNLSQDAFLERCKMSMKRSRLSQIEKGNDMYFSFDFLLKIAENFNCDIGYLLGEYDEKTREIHEICLATGLSQTAVEKIIAWKNTDDYHRFWGDIISAIIESENAESLLSYIDQINGFSKWEARAANENNANLALDMIDLQTSRLWYASKIFTDIIEDMSHKERMKEIEKNGKYKIT